MENNNLTFTVENRVAVLTLNRPERLNALNMQLLNELYDSIAQIHADPGILGVVITGQGRAFCAGADLKERLSKFREDASIYGDQLLSTLRLLLDSIESLGKPVIAAINGPAYGGGLELALACDIRIMASSVKVGLSEAKVGTIPGGGGTQRLPRLIGVARAKELLFSADPIDAARAYEIGLVNRVVPDGESVVQAALEMMERFTRNAPLALKMAKLAVNKGTEMSLQDGLDFEGACTAVLSKTEDRAEGVKAFQEKRSPQFQGR